MDKNIIFALDIGTRTVIGVIAEVAEDGRINIIAEKVKEHGERSMLDGQIHDIARVSQVVAEVKRELEEVVGFKLTKVAIAAAGRALYTVNSYAEMEVAGEVAARQVFELESRALAKALESLGNKSDVHYEIVGYSVLSYYLDGYPFKTLEGHKGRKIAVELVTTFLPQSVTSSLQAVLLRCGLEPLSLTLEPIAAIAAAVPETLRLLNIVLVDVGAGTSDIAVCRDGSVVAYGMVPEAGDEISEEVMRQFLVDFTEAEVIKQKLGKYEEMDFINILGQKVKLTAGEITAKIEPAVERVAQKIADEMMRLNGGAPKAVFLVGGGAKTYGLGAKLAQRLGIEPGRVVVKGYDLREKKLGRVPEILSGPDGVTVLGIILTALKNYDLGFFSVYLNGREVRLLSGRNLTVGEILRLSGVLPEEIFGREGKSLCFYLDGERRVVKGGLPRVAEIYLNGQQASLKTEVKEGDLIHFIPASNGEDAVLSIKELLEQLQENHKNLKLKVTKNGKELGEEYLIKEDDSLSLVSQEKTLGQDIPFLDEGQREVEVVLNGKPIRLKGKENYILADVLPYYGELPRKISSFKILLNGVESGFTSEIKAGDKIEIIL